MQEQCQNLRICPKSFDLSLRHTTSERGTHRHRSGLTATCEMVTEDPHDVRSFGDCLYGLYIRGAFLERVRGMLMHIRQKRCINRNGVRSMSDTPINR